MRAIGDILQGRAVTLLAVLIFAVQALLPAAAMAASPASAAETVICTPQGAKTILVGEDGAPSKAFAGLPCDECLMAVTAFVAPPQLQVQSVAYGVAIERPERVADQLAPRARAPPRPLGQGPPALHA